MWANTELQHFVSRFSCQVFRREMGVAAIGVCVSMAKQQCEKVTEIIQNVPFTIQEHKISLRYALMQQCNLGYKNNLKIIFSQILSEYLDDKTNIQAKMINNILIFATDLLVTNRVVVIQSINLYLHSLLFKIRNYNNENIKVILSYASAA